MKFRTKIMNLEKEISKYEKIVQELEKSGVLSTAVNQQQINESIMVMTLRKRVQDSNEEVRSKEEELDLIRRTIKYTNHKVLEVVIFFFF